MAAVYLAGLFAGGGSRSRVAVKLRWAWADQIVFILLLIKVHATGDPFERERTLCWSWSVSTAERESINRHEANIRHYAVQTTLRITALWCQKSIRHEFSRINKLNSFGLEKTLRLFNKWTESKRIKCLSAVWFGTNVIIHSICHRRKRERGRH